MSSSAIYVSCAVFALLGVTATLFRQRKRSPPEWNDLLHFWFESEARNAWFLAEGSQRDAIDEAIRCRFGELLEQCAKGEKDWWFEYGPRAGLALILVLDQLVRHVHRGNEERIQSCGVNARQLTRRAIERGDHHNVRRDELAFLLMPYRHEKPVNMENLEQVLSIVDERELRAMREKDVLSRFKRATEARLSEARSEFERINLMTRKKYNDEDILEPIPAPDHSLIERLPQKPHSQVWRVLNTYIDKIAKTELVLIVSLSGGVDSMVMLTILKSLIAERNSSMGIVAAHVDYGNRGESHAEADFVSRYCARMEVVCHIKKIEGLLRGVTNREEYESRSRELRFDFYKHIWMNELHLSGTPVVLFGHHEGDVVENVLSNAMKGKTILELSGMTEESTQSGCRIHRPMLSLTKDRIFDYSHRFGVPYFKDTTPRWSTRGQVRLEVLPCLERVYGHGFQLHLARLAAQSDEAFDLLFRDFLCDRIVSDEGFRTIRNHPVAFVFDLSERMEAKPLFLWRLALRKAAHDHDMLIATDKAVKFLYEALQGRQRTSQTSGWFVELRRGSRGYVWKNRFLVVFRNDPELCLPYQSGTPLTLLQDGDYTSFGQWLIKVVSADANDAQKSFTMDDLWHACISSKELVLEFAYTIPLSSNGRYNVVKTQQVVKSIESIDLTLRNGFLPIVLPDQPTRNREMAHVYVKWNWN